MTKLEKIAKSVCQSNGIEYYIVYDSQLDILKLGFRDSNRKGNQVSLLFFANSYILSNESYKIRNEILNRLNDNYEGRVYI